MERLIGISGVIRVAYVFVGNGTRYVLSISSMGVLLLHDIQPMLWLISPHSRAAYSSTDVS